METKRTQVTTCVDTLAVMVCSKGPLRLQHSQSQHLLLKLSRTFQVTPQHGNDLSFANMPILALLALNSEISNEEQGNRKKSSRNFAVINCFSSGLLTMHPFRGADNPSRNFPLFLPVPPPTEHCNQGAGEGRGDRDQ